MEKKIRQILKEIGINPIYKGYYYWIYLINFTYDENIVNLGDIIIEDLYWEIAKNLQITRYQLERNLRTAIKESQCNIKEYFNYKHKITNKSFLILMLEKLYWY